MKIRLSLLTILTAMCTIAEAGTIDNTLVTEHARTRCNIAEIKKDGGDIQPYIMKEMALVGIYNCMKPSSDEADTFCKCFKMASVLNGHMANERDDDLYANALEEIKSLVITKLINKQDKRDDDLYFNALEKIKLLKTTK